MTYHDEFDDPPRDGSLSFLGTIGPKVAFFAVLIALSFMVGVVWKLYVGANDDTGQSVPVVRADAEDFKVVPDDPGGMEIPHKDSTIFSSLKAQRDEDNPRIENLLADNDAEQPLPRSQLFAGLNTEKAADLSGDTDDVIEEDVAPEVQEAPPVLQAKEAKLKLAVPEKVEPALEEKPKPEVKPEPKAEEKKTASAPTSLFPAKTTSTPVSGDYYVQLGSVKSKDGAESEWKKLSSKYSGQLSGYSHRVETADLGAKGVFYRIQAGPVSKDAAVEACTAIKKITPGGCLVTK